MPLSVSIRHGEHLMDALAKGEIDFFVAGTRTTSATDIVQEHLYDDPYVIFASASHRLAGRKRIALADLSGERWASINATSRPHWRQLFRAMASKGLPPPAIALETNFVLFGAMRDFPELKFMLPQRPADATRCEQCGGSGVPPWAAGHPNVACTCVGAGWLLAGAAGMSRFADFE